MIKLKDVIKNKKLFSTKVEGSSMLPLLHPGDILSCRRTPFSDIATNDILMVAKEKRIFIHRVIYRTSKYLITKGDNTLLSDGRIYPHQVIGRVYQVKRNNKIFHLEDIYLLQSTLYFQEILKIKKEFEKEKINYVFLKGLPLHLRYESIHPKRIYADCDMLVKRRDQMKAQNILEKSGYQKVKNDLSRGHKLLKDKSTEVLYRKYINGFPIFFDLHFEVTFLMTQLGSLEALYPQKYIDNLTDMFLEEKRVIKIKGINMPVLSPDNLVVYLALHFFHHNFRGIFRLELLDEVVRKESKKISRLFDLCEEKILLYRLENFVYLTFLFLKKYYNTPLSEFFLAKIKPNDHILQYITDLLGRLRIFDGENRMQAGIDRFKNIFYLSPTPLMQKLLIFTIPQVIYSIFWTAYRRINSARQKNIF